MHCRYRADEDVQARVLDLLKSQPSKAGGARGWRLECASLLTTMLRHACQAVANDMPTYRACGGKRAPELAYRFMKTAAANFQPKKKSSWWGWVALAAGLMGSPVEVLTVFANRAGRDLCDQCKAAYDSATRRYGMEAVPPFSVNEATGQHRARELNPQEKRPLVYDLDPTEDQVQRIMEEKSGDPWSVLAMPLGGSTEAVRKRYKELAKLVHPDKKSKPHAHEAFCKLQGALEGALSAGSRRR